MAGLLLALGASSAIHAMGCAGRPDDNELRSKSSGTGGEGGSLPPDCMGDPTQDPKLVIDRCGKFVRASAAPGGDGTKAKPFKSLAEAAKAGAKRVYACAEVYSESAGVSFSGGVEIYAGFAACDGDWSWSKDATTKATLKGAADAIALELHQGNGKSHIERLDVVAGDATKDGGSSIAVLADGGAVEILHGSLTAGAAKDGKAGETPPDDAMLDGVKGGDGVGVCLGGANNPGPAAMVKMCPDGSASQAGNGGDGGLVAATIPQPAAGSGGDGSRKDTMGKDIAAMPPSGKGGAGESAGACSDGVKGAPGDSGAAGKGGVGRGKLSNSGYAGADGDPGQAGLPGQGGGGGGGGKGAKAVLCNGVTSDRVGASGGAGGSGGCGGRGGGGGQAGGSSVALLVVDAAVTLADDVTVTVGKAGNGGPGGSGQKGGRGGALGNAGTGVGNANDSCAGALGGAGGRGGPGGGGQGGHALGIALSGNQPVVAKMIKEPADASKGLGGTGGMGTPANGGNGDDGLARPCWDFTKNMACATP